MEDTGWSRLVSFSFTRNRLCGSTAPPFGFRKRTTLFLLVKPGSAGTRQCRHARVVEEGPALGVHCFNRLKFGQEIRQERIAELGFQIQLSGQIIFNIGGARGRPATLRGGNTVVAFGITIVAGIGCTEHGLHIGIDARHFDGARSNMTRRTHVGRNGSLTFFKLDAINHGGSKRRPSASGGQEASHLHFIYAHGTDQGNGPQKGHGHHLS